MNPVVLLRMLVTSVVLIRDRSLASVNVQIDFAFPVFNILPPITYEPWAPARHSLGLTLEREVEPLVLPSNIGRLPTSGGTSDSTTWSGRCHVPVGRTPLSAGVDSVRRHESESVGLSDHARYFVLRGLSTLVLRRSLRDTVSANQAAGANTHLARRSHSLRLTPGISVRFRVGTDHRNGTVARSIEASR
jgi:hypothetical protein